jgi:hypothetical protein
MQDTRLNRLVDTTIVGINQWLRNPWRLLSVQIISLLFGNFLGTALSTIAGQSAQYDIYVAAILMAVTEVVNRLVYDRTLRVTRSWLISVLNAVKIGFVYSLFVEAFKLGS